MKTAYNKRNFDLNKIRPIISKTSVGNNDNNPDGAKISVFFDNLEPRLLGYIRSSEYVIGCAAWLTNPDIMHELSKKKGTSIVINKEEYLNPKTAIGGTYYYNNMRKIYDSITGIFSTQCHCCNSDVDKCNNFMKNFAGLIVNEKSGVVTCGIVNNPSRLHHKFLIFLDKLYRPYAVWTGSYNLTKNSNYCLENALYITDQTIVRKFVSEYISAYNMSEPIRWTSGLLKSSLDIH